jgi:uncharacterized protein
MLQKIVERYGLNLVVLFGSKARGKTHRESDVDIAIRSDRRLSPDQLLSLATDLDHIYPNGDLCDLRSASPLLLAAIAQEGKPLFTRGESDFEEFRIFAINQYIDYKPFAEELRKKNREEINLLSKKE